MHLCFLLNGGIKVSEGNDDITVKQNGIDIPVNLKYTIGLGSFVGVFMWQPVPISSSTSRRRIT